VLVLALFMEEVEGCHFFLGCLGVLILPMPLPEPSRRLEPPQEPLLPRPEFPRFMFMRDALLWTCFLTA